MRLLRQSDPHCNSQELYPNTLYLKEINFLCLIISSSATKKKKNSSLQLFYFPQFFFYGIMIAD